jgi:membrane protein YdbS with pleckstrin-like domain
MTMPDPSASHPLSQPPVAAGPGTPHAVPGDQEEVYFEGSPPVRAYASKVFLCWLIGGILLALAALIIHKHLGPWWLIVAIIVVALAIPWFPWIFAKRVGYRITNYRIDFERGLLGKTIDTMELWHVEDLHFNQTLMDRIMNVGNITVLAKDETMPKLALYGIPNPRPLYEMLKQRVIAVKRQRGVVKMDQG